MYLNNRTIPMEVDLCSLVSVVTDDRLENSRILEIVRRTEIKSLGHEHSANSDCGIEKLYEIHQTRRQNPNIARVSDDPRRGGRREHLETPTFDEDCKGKLPKELSEAMSSDLSKIQEEGETNESDSEFHDAVSDVNEFEGKANPDIVPKDMGRKDDIKTDKDAINDSGFNEEEEHFELATE